MSEESLFLTAGDIRLEAMWSPKPGPRGAIVCHPHPLYGGDMDNGVVVTVARALNSCGFSALRFNFRGVGQSEGSYGEGVAEQEDLIAACDFLTAQGKSDIRGGRLFLRLVGRLPCGQKPAGNRTGARFASHRHDGYRFPRARHTFSGDLRGTRRLLPKKSTGNKTRRRTLFQGTAMDRQRGPFLWGAGKTNLNHDYGMVWSASRR